MAKLSTDQLIDAFKELTLIELSEFVSQFEDVFGVTAAAPVAVAAVGVVPVAAGVFDFCLLAPLFGHPFSGGRIRGAR